MGWLYFLGGWMFGLVWCAILSALRDPDERWQPMVSGARASMARKERLDDRGQGEPALCSGSESCWE